jgi:hypothetical protein
VEVQVLSSACDGAADEAALLVYFGRPFDAVRRTLYADGEHTFDHPPPTFAVRRADSWN